MELNENHHLQLFGVCHKLFYFIMRILAAQALKPVTLGPTVPPEQTQIQTRPGIHTRALTHDGTSLGGSIERLEECESDSSIDIEEVVSPLLDDGQVMVEMVGEVGVRGPGKVVSIKDEPEVIYLSNKRRKTMEEWRSEREKERKLRPLKSILKVGSSSDLGNSNGNVHRQT